MLRIVLFTSILLNSASVEAQWIKRAGLEYNYYPAGQIAGAQIEWTKLNHHAFNARIAANMAKRKNFSGLNDDERGWGPGFSLGYRYYLADHLCNGLFLGVRNDFWGMKINWTDSMATPNKGNTKILVVQPTFELGYNFPLKNGWRLTTAFVNGTEINVISKGEDVGQGWITLWHIGVTKEFGDLVNGKE